ncbi:group II intron reverse transcriptase/maturase [Nannocystis exedens]|uniref:Group II intron reverse transcriptase/maturase n=1 Tax=Nannocystis exedens TaxID=54 RepID=A0A1I2IYW4_9BACT|nr:group II intron reverse transcriptase/maturase [Nannocystis exedens]
MRPESVSTKQTRIATLARNNPKLVITSLNHHLDIEWLRHAYNLTRKDGAMGIDGQTAADYEKDLEANLQSLLDRIKSGRYKAPPVRRAHIPKADGSTRPLGIPTFEDKVAQRAIALLLEPIYEVDFQPCSYGFRRGRSAHMALREIRNQIMDCTIRWVLDVDIRQYFDTIDHRRLREFLDRRVVDGVVRKMIDKWLKAGVLEGGQVSHPETGTPQGGVISPLLANIFLHHVLDEWYQRDVRPRMKRRCFLVRFADDLVMGFEDFLDCIRVREVLGKRLSAYGLSLHPEKTKMVDFRFKRPDGGRHPATQATTFNFLGFTHVWGKSRRGKNVVHQRTAKDRYARALKAIRDWCRVNRHQPMEAQHKRLSQMMTGHYSYYGISGNGRRIRWFAHQVQRVWHYWLDRRSRGSQGRWKQFDRLLSAYPLPAPHIVHKYAEASKPAARGTGCGKPARPGL